MVTLTAEPETSTDKQTVLKQVLEGFTPEKAEQAREAVQEFGNALDEFKKRPVSRNTPDDERIGSIAIFDPSVIARLTREFESLRDGKPVEMGDMLFPHPDDLRRNYNSPPTIQPHDRLEHMSEAMGKVSELACEQAPDELARLERIKTKFDAATGEVIADLKNNGITINDTQQYSGTLRLIGEDRERAEKLVAQQQEQQKQEQEQTFKNAPVQEKIRQYVVDGNLDKYDTLITAIDAVLNVKDLLPPQKEGSYVADKELLAANAGFLETAREHLTTKRDALEKIATGSQVSAGEMASLADYPCPRYDMEPFLSGTHPYKSELSSSRKLHEADELVLAVANALKPVEEYTPASGNFTPADSKILRAKGTIAKAIDEVMVRAKQDSDGRYMRHPSSKIATAEKEYGITPEALLAEAHNLTAGQTEGESSAASRQVKAILENGPRSGFGPRGDTEIA